MINFRELREQFRNRSDETKRIEPFLISLFLTFIFLVFILFQNVDHAAEIPTEKAILAVIGEAENQGYIGMLAVSGCLRNRAKIMSNPLKGVYGLNSKRVREHLYSQRTYDLAREAWFASYYQDITNAATGWGNADDIKKFKKEKWWKNCVITAHIGDHWFYREGK